VEAFVHSSHGGSAPADKNLWLHTWPFSHSNHRLLLSASTFADCCRFLNVTIEDANVVPQSLWRYDPLTLRYMTSQQNIQSPRANEMTRD
jgi:hypothetical protein